MESTLNHIDDLIGKYLTGEASADEIQFIEKWIHHNEINRKYFEQIKTIFDRAVSVTEVQQFDTDAAWNNVKAKLLEKQDSKVIALDSKSRTISIFWRIAASIIILIGISFLFYKNQRSNVLHPMEVIAEKRPVTDTLPGGSIVYLNKQTKLEYSFNEKKETHIVKLKGEAYFNIKNNDEKTFIIQVDGLFIKDIGTSFNVKGYPESNTVEVVVEEGEVMFYTDNDSGVYLTANEKGIYNKHTKKFTLEQPEPNVTAYKTKLFTFSNTDLHSVVRTLNEVYDKKIKINERLSHCKLTVTFNNESIDEIATVIAETLTLTVNKSAQEITLEGEGCQE